MAKEPEDKHGASSADGENTPPETPSQDDSPSESTEGSGQSELPLDDAPEGGGSKAEFPKVDFPKSEMKEMAEEAESAHDDQAEDHAQHEDSHHAGELDSDHNEPQYDDPYHDEYHHDYHDDYHEEHHDEYHDEDHGDYVGGDDGDDGDRDDNEKEGFGGPIKPFLDHLEDFRFMVMKCVVAVVVGMLVALIGSPYIVTFLTWPLERAQQIKQVTTNPDKRPIPVQFGSGVVSHIREADLKNMAEAGSLPTGLHPSAGQEAVGVGACYGLRDTDWAIPALRSTEVFWTRVFDSMSITCASRRLLRIYSELILASCFHSDVSETP